MLGDIEAPGFSARSVNATFSGTKLRELVLSVGRLNIGGREWKNVRVTCGEFHATGASIACSRGVIEAPEKIAVRFSYSTHTNELEVELKPSADEKWQVSGRVGGPRRALRVRLDRARPARVQAFLPQIPVKLSAGQLSGTVEYDGASWVARLQIDGLGFSDPSGLRAAEKITGTLNADAVLKRDGWAWNVDISWRTGELFWDPFFLSGDGQRIKANGVSSSVMTELNAADFTIPGVGTIALRGRANHSKRSVESFELRADRVRLTGLYEKALKPLVQQTALADLTAEGAVTMSVNGSGDSIRAVDLQLQDVSIEDRQQHRFALNGVNARIPWRRDDQTAGEISFARGELLKVALGAARIPFRTRANGVSVSTARIPVLDGAVNVRDFAAGTTAEGWRWRFSGELEPISMTQVTKALGLPQMYGTLAGTIPEVRYRRETLSMDGTLVMHVFDGEITAAKVEFIEPFGRAPRLHADLAMNSLDLELLTRTFDFGTITGRIDARVQGLELVGAQPVKFDALISSSSGTYPKRISQRAVQNISALGGAGAAAAIQRSFLRFFEQFGYERIGLSCRLSQGVCEMGGIERAPQGYVIVKGGGIPAISVIGYNRYVSWTELVSRLKRITQQNVKPIVK